MGLIIRLSKGSQTYTKRASAVKKTDEIATKTELLQSELAQPQTVAPDYPA